MAIINSTVMGKTRGKIGNVVTTVLKGQVIAKSRNYAPANPKTPLQVDSRAKMSNAVLAWQFLSIFLVHILSFRKSTESTYNAFIRLTKNIFDIIVADSASMAASMLAGYSFGSAALAAISSLTRGSSDAEVVFATGGMAKPSDLKVRWINFTSETGENAITERVVTDSEWTAGTITDLSVSSNMDSVSVYFYSVMDKKCSNVKNI